MSESFDAMLAQLIREIGGDETLLEVILSELDAMRDATEIHPHLDEMRRLRTLVLSSHGEQGMEEWNALHDRLIQGNQHTRSIIASEDRQIKRRLANWRKETSDE